MDYIHKQWISQYKDNGIKFHHMWFQIAADQLSKLHHHFTAEAEKGIILMMIGALISQAEANLS